MQPRALCHGAVLIACLSCGSPSPTWFGGAFASARHEVVKADQTRQLARGAALFNGRPELPARLRHQDLRLPSQASRCSNCHLDSGRQAAIAPRLDTHWLQTARERHGGPPTSYERDSFCRLLRTGISPAEIVVTQSMPIYEIDDKQCDALWQHLTRVKPQAFPAQTVSLRKP